MGSTRLNYLYPDLQTSTPCKHKDKHKYKRQRQNVTQPNYLYAEVPPAKVNSVQRNETNAKGKHILLETSLN